MKGSKVAVKQGLLNTYNRTEGFDATSKLITRLQNVKNAVINALDPQEADIEAYTDGKRGGEGYVIDKDVKLVNRFRSNIIWQGTTNDRVYKLRESINGRRTYSTKPTKQQYGFINSLGEARMFKTRQQIKRKVLKA